MKFKLILALLLLPFSVMAATNQFSNVLVNDTLRSSNTFIRGYLGVTTNGPLSGSTTVVIRPRDATPTVNQLQLLADGVGNTAAFRFGDFNTGPVGLLGTDGAGNGRLNWDSVGTFTLNVEGEAVLTATESLIIYGSSASDAHTFNGSTFTFANPATINSGVLIIPPAGGTVSNNTSFVTMNTSFTSNSVVFFSESIGTNAPSAGGYNLLVQGLGTSTSVVFRAGASTYTDVLQIQSVAGARQIGLRDNGTITFGSAGASSLSNPQAGLSANGSSATFKNIGNAVNSTTVIAGGTNTGGDVIFHVNNGLEKGRFTLNGFIIGSNAQPGAVAINWWGATNFVWAPGSVATASTVATNMSMTGAITGYPIYFGTSVLRAGLIWSGSVTNDGVVTIQVSNITLGSIDPGSHTVRVRQSVSP